VGKNYLPWEQLGQCLLLVERTWGKL